IVNNAIWVNNYDGNGTSALNFEVTNGGGYIFDDEIDGGFYDWNDEAPIKDGYGYNVNIYGDVCPQCIVNSVIFNSKVKNVYNLTLDTTQMVLGKNAHIEIVNDYIAQNNPYLRLNVDAVNSKTGQLEIGGQVIGTTQVIANIVNYKDVRGEESIVFATALNDTTGSAESFKIFRTVGSPYKWYVDYDETAKTWGLAMGENINDYEEDCYPNQEPSPKPLGPIQVEPEVIAMEALPSAGLAQTSGMIYNIMRKVGNSYIYCPGCGFYDPNWDGEPFHNVWVDTTYNGLTIEAPVEIDAKVWGIEAGADIQKDLNNKLGIFVSYRQGNYEMDGKGDKYFAKLGSELDIDSYLAGLYYRYDNNNWYAFATLYGGMQNAEIKTDDGVSADTDGLEFGGSAEIGYSHALNKTVYITPSLGVFYSQISYDDASDDYGKTVEYGDLKQVELEAGLKLSKAVYTDNGTASVYVKPSVVQTLVDGDEINITEIGKVDTIEDKTLGRIEIGGNYGFNDNWSAYGWANYTFGSDYEATSLGAGVNYAW
ncbi:MAG: autotransporter domain-containing protein, partial [Alphaproteobacteria bacterium]|nr:autotransporter domain-containing protein [Alphaproteobacteria bacterium]